MATCRLTLVLTWLTLAPSLTWAQNSDCFSTGTIVGAVLGTLLITLATISIAFVIWRICCRRKPTRGNLVEFFVKIVKIINEETNKCVKIILINHKIMPEQRKMCRVNPGVYEDHIFHLIEKKIKINWTLDLISDV